MQVPSPKRVSALASKRILRRFAEGRLPKEVLTRKKLGFNGPMGVWLRRDLDRLTREWLAPDIVSRRGLFDPGQVEALVAEHRAGARDHGLRLWSLVVLEQWQRSYQDAPASRALAE